MKKHSITIAAAFLMMAATTQATASNPAVIAEDAIETPTETNPSMRKAGDRVFVNYLNLEGSTVVVRVLDEENRLLYFERFTESPVVEKAINFEQALSGTYRVEVKVSGGDRSYSESLKVVR